METNNYNTVTATNNYDTSAPTLNTVTLDPYMIKSNIATS